MWTPLNRVDGSLAAQAHPARPPSGPAVPPLTANAAEFIWCGNMKPTPSGEVTVELHASVLLHGGIS
jgi:hypothetical protein